MKVVETFEVVRKFLGWSYQEVSVKSGKYSPEYLKQVHQGRPFPGVEKDLIVTYIRGLAERAVYLVFGEQVASDLRDKLIAKFAQVVRQNRLSLNGAQALVERVSSEKVSEATARYRTGIMDVGSIDIAWEGLLEAIIDELDKSMQGTLPEDSDGTADGSTHSSPVSDVPTFSYQPKRDPRAILSECNFCHKPLPENRDSRHTCGQSNDDYV